MIIPMHMHNLLGHVHNPWYVLPGIGEFLNTRLLPRLRRPRTRVRSVSLPRGVRKEKVLAMRRELEAGTYDIDGRFSEAIDKVLEEMTADKPS